MKTTTVLSLILAAGLAQAAPRMNFSTKTGLRMEDSVSCLPLDPIRYAAITAEVNQYITVTDPLDGSISFQNSSVCKDIKGSVGVYEIPDNIACYGISQSLTDECKFTDSEGNSAKAVIFGGIFLKKENTKTFTAFLSTLQTFKRNFEGSSATVFDPGLEKILLSVTNRNLGPVGGLIDESVTANILLEDKLP
ncbi:MAG: hypothetical protein ACXWC9_05875 [Pseudobdellovibrionaceae bacterium]